MIVMLDFLFYAYITSALQRLERPSKVNWIDKLKLENGLYSRATLSSLSLVLLQKTYTKWITEMTKNDLNYKNHAYQVFKNLCIIERNTSEGSRDPDRSNSPISKTRSLRPKPKSVHKAQKWWKLTLMKILNGCVCYHIPWYSVVTNQP